MFSLDNAYSKDELFEFLKPRGDGLPEGETPRFCVEPKLDGASVEVVLRQAGASRKPPRAATARAGEDITQNVRTLRSLPLERPAPGEAHLARGGGHLPKDFEQMNAEREEAGEPPFANPSNAAAGAVRMLDPREVAQPSVAGGLLPAGGGAATFTSRTREPRLAREDGPPDAPQTAAGHQRDEVAEGIAHFDEARHGYPFETDGAVVKVDASGNRTCWA